MSRCRTTVRIVRRLSDIVALGASFAGIAYGAYLLVVGRDGTFVPPEGATGTVTTLSLSGLLPLGIGLLALWATVKHRPSGLWAAAGVATILSLLFLFSLALQFAALAALLLIAAVVSTLSSRGMQGS